MDREFLPPYSKYVSRAQSPIKILGDPPKISGIKPSKKEDEIPDLILGPPRVKSKSGKTSRRWRKKGKFPTNKSSNPNWRKRG